MNYEEPQKATIRRHKLELVDQLKYELNTLTAEEVAERGHIIEEYGRILDQLADRDETETITLMYSDGLNYFEELSEDR